MTDYRKLFDLTGKTAVVLGAASGIGKSSAEALAALGAGVLCADKSEDGAQATAAAIRERGGMAEAAACDAASAADVASLAATALRTFPRLDIAVTTPRRISTASSTSTSRARCSFSRPSAASWSSRRAAA